jgi:hypothetical protein
MEQLDNLKHVGAAEEDGSKARAKTVKSGEVVKGADVDTPTALHIAGYDRFDRWFG